MCSRDSQGGVHDSHVHDSHAFVHFCPGILARGIDQQMFFQRFAILFGQLAKAYFSHAPSGQ
jgi:hypothetical protein